MDLDSSLALEHKATKSRMSSQLVLHIPFHSLAVILTRRKFDPVVQHQSCCNESDLRSAKWRPTQPVRPYGTALVPELIYLRQEFGYMELFAYQHRKEQMPFCP
ncbi:uncharacterized protein N7529_006001 [Penicillium soppii]|jgi:hypothetical protein|uniref:uncharacterized protein n=1 Tax=Penicillium soppii TaxID=69789 RepID=UPI002549408E|nr:uncharacterized protein N7529_006001 [Penicillium soppii]KAJ5864085.1 hypothetical protein N7529_006001 [Penicillium soppii]